ncbi:MAG: DNA polymerase III, subunit gamma and tau [Spirochaetes bacterium GWF1_31_7]|nr:MAG: DNA polymerase III, subunit gamma and tau [Spirochaetes bacterium GWE1_32_154]OHD50025.1 MAG: DNA polymerase III, subunit gamma and tau [Spirochaetes bacterium GWE2_31_10]OHD52339.1 MAG: DNA polymerase III, subunit gamma and tau [Spirochaetes bacterium GWF1_31_7]OHD73186.1 MAG: DNA polymerase III, subunit gamma and tau [Spirochaetes bacterium RIFOXYB1_FULL_32_8]HBI38490.1 DNA polymerase III subunit gamma/tau [Spirochaetia bacterium]
MAHEVTATKYRPQSFETLEGQEFVTAALKNSLENKTIANAFLLSGPRGVGKTTTARLLAKGLNCEKGPTGTPCNKCQFCISITAGNNGDVIEIDGASNTSINDIKIIQEEIQYPPVTSRYKVYIIDEVHMLSRNAFNALLKTIEEPPEKVVFIFATTEINEVPATIKSRCQQFNLRLIPSELIYKNLELVLKDKQISYDPEAIKWIASEGNGSMRDSYTLLDQIISFCSNEITLKKIQNKLGIAGEEKISLLVESIIEKNIGSIFSNLNHILENGISSEQLLIELIKYFRNLLLIKSNISLKKEIDFDPVFYSDTILSLFTTDDIENIIEISFLTYEKARYSIDFKTELEIFLLKISKYKDFIRPKQILRQLASLQDSLTNKSNISIEKKKFDLIPNTVNQKSIPTENKTHSKQKIILEADKSDLLKTLIEILVDKDFELHKAIQNVILIEEDGFTITLHLNREMFYDLIQKNIQLLTKEINILLGHSFVIKAKLNQELESKTKKNNSIINKESIVSIFNGIEIN